MEILYPLNQPNPRSILEPELSNRLLIWPQKTRNTQKKSRKRIFRLFCVFRGHKAARSEPELL